MTVFPHEPSGLAKAAWTDADYPQMGWHDCPRHAISIGGYEDDTLPPARLLLDLDYIVRWVKAGRAFTFWVAPATLIFERAWNIEGQLGPLHETLEIADLHRLDPPDDGPDPLWRLEGQNFDLRLRAAGFLQYVRTLPRHVPRPKLTPAERGGISFGGPITG